MPGPEAGINLITALGPVGKGLERIGNYLTQIEQPNPAELTELLLTGHIVESDYRSGMSAYGYGFDINDRLRATFLANRFGTLILSQEPHRDYRSMNARWLLTQHYKPSLPEIYTLLNRGLISDEVARYYMMKWQFSGQAELETYLSLRYEIPPIADLIRFSVREAFTPSLVEKFGYQNEFPSDVAYWAAKQGLGGNTGVPRPKGFDGEGKPLPPGNATWSELYWWSHWELPSPTQGYDMFHRLYKESRYGPSPDTKGQFFFSGADLELLQKAHDIPTYWRKLLQAISYRPLTRTDVRRMYELGVMKEPEVYHAYRQGGYDDTNANHLTNFTKASTLKFSPRNMAWAKAEKVCKQFTVGTISRGKAISLLTDSGFNRSEAELQVSSCELEAKTTRVQASLTTVRGEYLKGGYDDDECYRLLIALGIIATRADEYVTLWRIHKQALRHKVTMRQLISWFENSIISEIELVARLQNLRFADRDITRITLHAKRRVAIKLGKEVERRRKEDEKELERRKKLLEKKRKEDEKRQRESEKRIMSAFTDKNLIKFYQADLMDREQIKAVLFARGWLEETVNDWLDAYTPEKKEKGDDSEIP